MPEDTALASEIRDEIGRTGGQIPFIRFMDMALYHPVHGYYRSKRRTRIGRAGDFMTSVSAGALFGRILAQQFVAWREELGRPRDFLVVEFGGHRGELRADVLAAAPDLDYQVAEAGDALPEHITGCVFSNEFLDALPVHRVRVEQGLWREVYVDAKFREISGPLTDPRLSALLSRLPAHLMENYTTEINLRALDWLADVARRLHRGFILTVDYGYEFADYFSPHRTSGTLQCYRQHTKSSDPYRHIGEQDITAHVEFTSLMEQGAKCGLATVLLTDQARFLTRAGEKEIAGIAEIHAGQFSRERAAVHQLIHPAMMGGVFKVLVQEKN